MATSREDHTSPRSLVERTALVTGGARRIGHTLALALAEAGSNVVIHYLTSETEARATAAQVKEMGADAVLVRGDLADAAVAARLIEEAAAAIGPLDILINNASIFAPNSLATTTLEAWDRNQAVNLRAPFLLSQAFSHQLPAGRFGDILNLNDYRGVYPGDDHFAYTISKVGLHGLTRSLALALAPQVRVNELALGAVLPPEGSSEDYLHVLKQEIPTHRFSEPAEVVSAMMFLLNNRAITGQTVFIDGGRNLV